MPDPFDTPGSHPLFVVDGWVVCVYVSDRGSSVHMYRERLAEHPPPLHDLASGMRGLDAKIAHNRRKETP